MKKSITILSSLDTKAREARYLRGCIRDIGDVPVLVDIGYGGQAGLEADFTADDVATATGSDIETVRAMPDTAAASTLMMQGAIIRVQELLRSGRCDGIISFGGASNTTLSTGVMKTLPVGIPKLVISSSAAMPAYAAMYFGSKDITMMHSVVDISGLNDLTRAFLKRGAGAICGMASVSDGAVHTPRGSKVVAVTSFRFAEGCSQVTMNALEQLGYSTIPFHAQGVGENAMEELISQGFFQGVIDVVPAGLSEQMLGGNRAAKPERLEAAGRAGVPYVIAPSGFDMISCGPIDRRDSGDPLWRRLNISERQYSIPDRFRVEARTTADEVAGIALAVAEKLNKTSSPASVLVPLRGWSSLSTKGAELYDPEADAAFIPVLRASLESRLPVVEIDAELNSREFGLALASELDRLIKSTNAVDDSVSMEQQ